MFYSYFSTVNVQPREPSLCQLYRHTSPLLYIVLTWLICVNAVDGLAGDVGAVLNTLPYSGMRQVRLLIACSRPVYFESCFCVYANFSCTVCYRCLQCVDDVGWCGYLSGSRCRLFAYGPADATASQNPIISCLL